LSIRINHKEAMMKKKAKYVLLAAVMATDAAAYQQGSMETLATTVNPYKTLKPVISSTLPDNLPPFTASADSTLNRPFFDYFSWQSFIALAWPADLATRGAPRSPNKARTFIKSYPLKNAPSSTPAVFMSYRDVTQLFPPSGVPVDWDSSQPAYSPCTNSGPDTPYIGDSVASDTNEAGLYIADDSPVVDQHSNYARFETKFNKQEYTQVVNNKWYVQTNTAIALDSGSVEIKAAWRKMQKGDDFSRYYVVNMLATDPNTPTNQQGLCTIQPMGLIGFHIMHKTKDQPQWIWSTFEQVDNVGFNNDPTKPGSFTNGNPDQATMQNGYSYKPAQLPPTVENPAPVVVYRITPIATTPVDTTRNFPHGVSTAGMNQTYRNLLKKTIWSNYQLVATQWPSQPDQELKGGVPFPSSSVANTVIETFGLTANSPTCMGCHVTAASDNQSRDYSWTLAIRPRPDPAAAPAPAVRVKPGHN